MSSNLNCEVRGDVLIATIAGRIDGQTGPALQDQLLAAMSQATHAVYDMAQVPFMSSAGFRLLLLLYRTVSIKGGQLAMVGLSDEIRDTMDMTGFLDFFLVCKTLDEGLTKVRNEPVEHARAR
jgi:anti-sigma B factor antagonist